MEGLEGDIRFKCSECELSFTDDSYLADHWLATHLKTHDGPSSPSKPAPSKKQKKGSSYYLGNPYTRYRCPICGKTFATQKKSREHADSHPKVFSCRSCPRNFGSLKLLERHELTHRVFDCQWCDKSFAKASSLKGHLKKHAGKKPYICADCHQRFNQLESFWQHFEQNPTHRPENRRDTKATILKCLNATENESMAECDFPNCHAMFPSEEMLNEHILFHKSGVPNAEVEVIDVDDSPDEDEDRLHESEESETPEEENLVVLCLLCCFSFYRDDDALPENLSRSCGFDQFVGEVLKGEEVEGKSCSDLLSVIRNLSICQDCRNLIKEAMKKRQEVIETGKMVRRKMEGSSKAFGEAMAEYALDMRRIEKVVEGGDVGCLDVHLIRAERKLEGNGTKCWVRLLREKIGSHASKLEESSKKLRLNKEDPTGLNRGANVDANNLEGLGNEFQVKTEEDYKLM